MTPQATPTPPGLPHWSWGWEKFGAAYAYAAYHPRNRRMQGVCCIRRPGQAHRAAGTGRNLGLHTRMQRITRETGVCSLYATLLSREIRVCSLAKRVVYEKYAFRQAAYAYFSRKERRIQAAYAVSRVIRCIRPRSTPRLLRLRASNLGVPVRSDQPSFQPPFGVPCTSHPSIRALLRPVTSAWPA